MKKLKFLLIIFCLIIFSGCGSKTEVIDKPESIDEPEVIECTAENKEQGYEAVYKIKPKDDKYVKSVTTIETINSTDDDVKQYYKNTVDELYSTMNSKYGGYTYKFDMQDDKLVVTATIDYDVMDVKQYIIDTPGSKSMVDDDYKVTIDGVKSLYKVLLNATCE